MQPPAAAAPAAPSSRDHHAACNALAALVDAGVPADDPRLLPLLALLRASAPPPPPPPAPPLANPHALPPPALARPTALAAAAAAAAAAAEPAAPAAATPTAAQNAQAVLAARLALEARAAPPPSPPASATRLARKGPPLSALHAARHVVAAPRRASRRAAPEPAVHTADGPLPARAALHLRAQVAAYRRVLRAAPLAPELLAASRGPARPRPHPVPAPAADTGLPPTATAATAAPVVARRPRAEGACPALYTPAAEWLPSVAPESFPDGHVFERADVVGEAEDVSDEEAAERVALAQVRHDRIRAEAAARRSSAADPSSYRVEERLDPRVAQLHAQLIGAVLSDAASFPPPKEAGGTVSARAEQKSSAPPRTPGTPGEHSPSSVLRDRATAPISVVTHGKHAPGYITLRKQRELRLAKRITSRMRQLTELPPTLPDDAKRCAAREAKELKLIPLQRAVRARVRGTMLRVLDRPAVADLRVHVRGLFKRRQHTFTHSGGMVPGGRMLGQRPANLRVEQEVRRRQRRLNMMNGLMNHTHQFRSAAHSRAILHKRLLKDLDRYFRDRSREEERRKKREQVERLRALRNNNEDEYLELLKATKNKRLIQLLKQTDEYLVQIGAQVERQKQTAREQDDKANKAKGGTKADGPSTEAEQGQPSDSQEGADDDELTQLKKRRNDYYTITHTISEKVHQPQCLVGGKLKPYQVEGLEWLVSLFNNNLNGILADEMGLGKTIQTLSLITYLVEVKRVYGPFLVIVPLSVMSNWVRELDLWAPSLTKVVYRGDPATRKNIQTYEMSGGNYNVLLTTYEFVVKDKNVLGKIYWKYIIMDEGHRMKNADCKLALTLGAKYKSRNRLLLTGTPLQNNMTELWALLNFLLPTIFSSAETFETWFNAPFQASTLGGSAELNEEENLLIISRLHQVLRPFMLRRLKTDVEAQLPDKVEIVFRCEMSVWQRVLYRQMRAKLGIASGAGNVGVRSFNNMVMQLKKVCNHPFLFYEEEELMSIPREYLMRASGKFELLDHCLRKLKRSGHRVLLFSQMTAALNYLEYFMSIIGMKHLRLDGTTKAEDRQEMLEQFNAQDSDIFCFLLSTRAGGLGLNLQTADTVIIFDSDWNPMMDLQAQDRAHRIGQTKEVRVYRLICSGSIEVKILERANRKLQIDAQVIQAGQFNNKSSDSDRQEMLKDLLRQQNGDDAVTNADVTALGEINKKLARSEEELELFEQMDAEAAALREGKPRLLVSEDELPSWVLKPEVDKKQRDRDQIGNILEHGRGRRKRKEVLYDDNLTEREWTAAMEEEGDIKEAIKRKRRKLNAQVTPVESSSADDGELPIDPESDAADQASELEKREATPLSKDEDTAGEKSDRQQRSSATKLEPFVDPDLHKAPRPRRKRGRPRKGRGR